MPLISVSQETRKKLFQLKYSMELSTVGLVIETLLEARERLKKLLDEKREQEQEPEQEPESPTALNFSG